MNWIYLVLAGFFEMGWPLGFKLSQTMPQYRVGWLVFGAVAMAISGVLLWLAQREIPIGTAYAIWTGIGAVGTLIIGVVFFGDAATIWRLLSAVLIIAGVIGLKLAH